MKELQGRKFSNVTDVSPCYQPADIINNNTNYCKKSPILECTDSTDTSLLRSTRINWLLSRKNNDLFPVFMVPPKMSIVRRAKRF